MAASIIVQADQCKVWEKSGKNEFIKFCKSQVQSGRQLWEGVSKSDLKRAVYELCWHSLRGALKSDQAATALSEISDMHSDIPSVVADVFSIIGTGSLPNFGLHIESKSLGIEKFESLDLIFGK